MTWSVEGVPILSPEHEKLKYKEIVLSILILTDIIAIIYISFYPVTPIIVSSVTIFDLLLCVILFMEFL